jgi:Rrf2 family transcriptional regulator, cysteine metabolism repressor
MPRGAAGVGRVAGPRLDSAPPFSQLERKETRLFTLSARGIYGLTAMVELGAHFERGPMQIREIADSHDIPQHYLEQILVTLKKAGLVDSHRGAQGGYVLARRPGRIAVLDILGTLEGPLEVVPAQRKRGAMDSFWTELDRKIRDFLGLSLEELMEKTTTARDELTYSI